MFDTVLAQLEAALFSALQRTERVTLGYSGGIDSSLMAYLLGRWQAQNPNANARLVHVHHGLSSNADAWLQHCRQQAERLGLSFESFQVQLTPKPRTSIEALARDARYQIFRQILRQDESLLTGHHQDDQAETFLLALKRGSGPTGLSAMARSQPFAQGQLLRPWLGISREQIEQAAAAVGLDHIEDESNLDERYDRNFVRHQVLPLLQQRWPGVNASIVRSAELCAEQQSLCDEMAQQDYLHCRLANDGISLSGSEQFSQARKNNLLRYFLRQQGALMPSQQQLRQLSTMWDARPDSQPQLNWGRWQLRRYLDGLYLLPKKQASDLSDHPWNHGKLRNGQHWLLKPCYDEPRLRLPKQDELVSVRYDLPGSTRMQPLERNKSRPLKKLWQEYQVPPWQRSQVAMLCYGDRVVAALGYWLERDFVAVEGEGWRPELATDTK